MNEVVKYHNELNNISFAGFGEQELNFLMAICSRMKEMGETTMIFSFDYMKDLVEWDRKQNNKLFIKKIDDMNSKLIHANGKINKENGGITRFTLFPTLDIDPEKQEITINVNKKFAYLLNNLAKDFTRFELKEYTGLDGRYAKLLYQNLKQYRSTGWWEVSVNEIRNHLSIPDSYEIKHIMDKVIKPSIAVIRSCKGFNELNVEVLRSRRRGRAIVGYRFTWTAEKQTPGQINMEDAKREMEKYKKSKSNKKNSFNQYPQREYDYEELERQLIINQTDEERKNG